MRLALILFATLALADSTNRPLVADDTPKTTSAARSKAPDTPDDDERQIRVFPLHHVDATVATEMLKQLTYAGNYAADSRTNSLIAHDSKVRLATLELLLKTIDRPAEPGANLNPRAVYSATEPSHPGANPATAPSNNVGLPGPVRMSNNIGSSDDMLIHRDHATPSKAAPEGVRKFRAAFNQRDAQAAQAAAELRQLHSRLGNPGFGGQENQQVADLQHRLRDLVGAAYDARTQMQQAEVKWLRERLSRIEGQLENRGRLKDQIIDRRIEELLNPGIRWDPGFGATTERGPENQMASESDVSAREKKAQTLDSLKQLALAMHNFHDTYGHFPKAVSTARDFGHKTDTPHSWRIDLLPFLGAADLYQQYNMNEPWDGPNNKKLLDRMPAVFRSPYDDPKSTSTAYAVLVGKGTIFEPSGKGIKISDITDGTSNTILVVEARRNCPWMKPEDIPFDADKPVPELGGFVENKFAAALADGSAWLFERSKVEDILKWMILRNDDTPIKIPFE